MNENTNNPYQRKVGFFGSVKQLGVTTVSNANKIVIDLGTTTTGITGSTAVASTVLNEAVSIWGESLLEDLRADQQIDRVHREIEQIQQQSQLDALKAELSALKAKRPVGRPKGATNV